MWNLLTRQKRKTWRIRLKKKKFKNTLLMIPDNRKYIAMFKGSQTSPVCPFNKNSVTFKMIMQH